MQMDPVIRSRRKALREAHAWLQALAREMNDPHALQVLNSAAFSFGAEKLRGFDRQTGKAGVSQRDNLDQTPPAIPKTPPAGEKPED